MLEAIPYLRYGPNARQRPGLRFYHRTTSTSLNTGPGIGTTGLNTGTGTGQDTAAAEYAENPWIRNTYHDDLKDAQNFARTIITVVQIQEDVPRGYRDAG